MKFYCYKEFPVDYSNLSVDELDEKIKAEQERLKKIKNGKIFLKLKIMSFKSPLLRQRAFLMPEKEGAMNDIALGLLQRGLVGCVAFLL